jgi:hypothetical protein
MSKDKSNFSILFYDGHNLLASLKLKSLNPTGMGGHRIEGIGNKHILWIHEEKHRLS